MKKSYIYLLFLIAIVQCQKSDGTEGYYISPHGMTRQRQVHDALEKVATRFSVDRTTYYKGSASYVASNFTVQLTYLDGKQAIEIINDNQVYVSGGRFEIYLTFNFSKTEAGRTTNGYATGSVISQSFNYTKGLAFGDGGYLIWTLPAGSDAVKKLTIFNKFRIKRIQPFNQTDVQALDQMIDGSGGQVSPSTVQMQIIDKFNSIMPITLNTTLHAYVLGPQIDYQFHHPVKGKLPMKIIHHNYGFKVTPEDGFKVIFLTQIADWPEPVCDGQHVPQSHLPWEFYGGTQNIHLLCLYQEVLQYNQKKGWLDTKLDVNWDSNAFQFYAGDLYQLINNLHLSVSPRQLIDGQCKANPDKLTIKYARQTHANALAVTISYSCTAKTRNKTQSYVDVLNFNADVKLVIQPKADKITLDFTVIAAEVLYLQFKPVGQYYVTNNDLALFKVNEGMKLLLGTKVFGTGFPTLARQLPYAQARAQYVIYSDRSHREFIPTNFVDQ